MEISVSVVNDFLCFICEDCGDGDQSKYDHEGGSVNVHRFETPVSYETFLQNGLVKNEICIFSSWLTEEWTCRKNWTVKTHGNVSSPNFAEISKIQPDSPVPVASICPEESCQTKEIWKLQQYLNYWKNVSQEQENKEKLFYLKDWHFCKEFPDYPLYSTPVFFTSDWLNEMWREKRHPFGDDFRFVYMGPKNSWTPFHADVYRSYSWSANICGKKKWIFYRPGSEKKLKDHFNNLPFDVRTLQDKNNDSDVIEIIQEAGETIFVPSGWYHQVHNLEDTISINHNWVNACNIGHVWNFFQSELADVEKEISDCRDTMNDDEWFQQCQMIMKVNTGMDYIEFFALLRNVTQLRIKTLNRVINEMKSSESALENNEKTKKPEDSIRAETFRKIITDLKCFLPQIKKIHPELMSIIIDLTSILPVVCSFAKALDSLLKGNKFERNCMSLSSEITLDLINEILSGLNRIILSSKQNNQVF